jgi:hypothetical protein
MPNLSRESCLQWIVGILVGILLVSSGYAANDLKKTVDSKLDSHVYYKDQERRDKRVDELVNRFDRLITDLPALLDKRNRELRNELRPSGDIRREVQPKGRVKEGLRN